jgi:hypothetical protein
MMDELSQKADMELAREVAERQHDYESGQDNIKVKCTVGVLQMLRLVSH